MSFSSLFIKLKSAWQQLRTNWTWGYKKNDNNMFSQKCDRVKDKLFKKKNSSSFLIFFFSEISHCETCTTSFATYRLSRPKNDWARGKEQCESSRSVYRMSPAAFQCFSGTSKACVSVNCRKTPEYPYRWGKHYNSSEKVPNLSQWIWTQNRYVMVWTTTSPCLTYTSLLK